MQSFIDDFKIVLSLNQILSQIVTLKNNQSCRDLFSTVVSRYQRSALTINLSALLSLSRGTFGSDPQAHNERLQQNI